MGDYWNRTGKHEKLYRMLWDKLVPDTGMARTTHGEALRVVSRIYNDYYINGFGNVGALYDMWRWLYRIRDDYTELGITERELEKFSGLMLDCFFAEEEDNRFTFEELEEKGMGRLLEKLADSVIVYAGMTQRQIEGHNDIQ